MLRAARLQVDELKARRLHVDKSRAGVDKLRAGPAGGKLEGGATVSR